MMITERCTIPSLPRTAVGPGPTVSAIRIACRVCRAGPAEQLEAARSALLPDVLPGPGDPPLRVLFCGINPGLVSAATGHHFARPGNRFWPALYGAGLTPRLLLPAEQGELAALGLGVTNVAPRATARADELDARGARGRRRSGSGPWSPRPGRPGWRCSA